MANQGLIANMRQDCDEMDHKIVQMQNQLQRAANRLSKNIFCDQIK